MTMTPKEFRTRLLDFANSIGPKAEIWVWINTFDSSKGALSARVYPTGITNKIGITAHADEFDALLEVLQGKWADYVSTYKHQTIRRIALEIIRITAESEWGCTDAALRQAGIDADDLVHYGTAAEMDANTIAANGPFSIRYGGSPNGSPKEELEHVSKI